MLSMFITIDFGAIGGILADLGVSILSYAGIAAILYAIGDILIRTVSWTFDVLFVKFIAIFYKYFETIINGTLLTDSVVKGMMDRVYLLVGVIVVFRLGMLLFNYILNPSEVMDEKVGVNALVKRVVIGLILIIFMPNIFGYAFQLQKAILEDRVIERIIMPEEDIQKAKQYAEEHGMGKVIAMTIHRGFFSIAPTASSEAKSNFDDATNINKSYDLTIIGKLGSLMNEGIIHKSNGEYSHDYFPILSTIVLGYVLYLVIQYCLDAVVRSFKLSILQVLAPIAIVEYMINSDRNEVFKSWKKAVISTFAMLFLRVASLWFVTYIVTLMNSETLKNSGSLLVTEDHLLRAIIVLGLLAFMLEFPKMMSDIFGLDLEQNSGVKNVMGKMMSAGKMVGGAAMMAGGAAIGGAVGRAKAGLHGRKEQQQALHDLREGKINTKEYGDRMDKIKQNTKSAKHAAALGSMKGAGLAAMSMIPANGAFASGFSGSVAAVDKEEQKQKMSQEKEEQQAFQGKQIELAEQQAKATQKVNYKLGIDQTMDIDKETNPEIKSYAQGLKDAGFKGISDHVQVTAEKVVEMKEDTKVVRDNSTASLVQQEVANQKLDDINIKSEAMVNNLVEINDNTFYSGIESINNLEDSGYVSSPRTQTMTTENTIERNNNYTIKDKTTISGDNSSSTPDLSGMDKAQDMTLTDSATIEKITTFNTSNKTETLKDKPIEVKTEFNPEHMDG